MVSLNVNSKTVWFLEFYCGYFFRTGMSWKKATGPGKFWESFELK